jgi:hypothetical protein
MSGWAPSFKMTLLYARVRSLYLSLANEIPGLPAHRGNLGLRYRIRNSASLGLFVQACSKQKVIYDVRYQERYGFPVAGRTVGLSLKAGF